MISDIQFCKTAIGCEGVVIGALHTNGSINKEQTKAMVKAAKPMHVTFHRAFDEGNNLQKNLEDVIRLWLRYPFNFRTSKEYFLRI